MSAKDQKRELLQALGECLAPVGFAPRLAQRAFVRRFSGGHASIHLAFVDHRDDFDAVIDVAIRFDAVEAMVNEMVVHLPAKEKSQTHTLGSELGALQGQGQRRWTVTTATDPQEVAAAMMEPIMSVGIPFIEKYSDMSRALDALVNSDKSAWAFCPIHSKRAKTVLALATSLGRQHLIQELTASQLAYLKALDNDRGYRDFEAFAKRFRN